LNTTQGGGVRAAIRYIGARPLHEATRREDHLTVHSVRTFGGAWNVIVDQDAASDGSRKGIALEAADARELARLLLEAATARPPGRDRPTGTGLRERGSGTRAS